ncbi:TetR/AcrR family transcriptional regulator [Parafrankia elaeagni]|uniref:TetR/AcrR family transcriptional regulator n=1 Tax=Parafrankia elaeagni TaxID=222534 RepID=UPI00036A8FE2|nr:TetR/AcrR family transcriptional regulator [Parafrankia elaeagni]
MASSKETDIRILEAAMKTIARRGPQRLSLSDVCDTAGVSRGTLYRYFKSKDDLLTALGQYVQDSLIDTINSAVEEDPDPRHRFRVLSGAILLYHDLHPEVAMVAEAEPNFALPFIREHFPSFIQLVTELLKPVVKEIPAVQSGIIREEDLAEILLRLTTSVVFIPTRKAQEVIDTIVAIFTPDTAAQPPNSAPAPDTSTPAATGSPPKTDLVPAFQTPPW